MNERSRSACYGALTLAWIGGCADPCVDDGLSQKGDSVCPVAAGGTQGGGSATTDETTSAPDGCNNGAKDGDETDVDCGGSCMDQCGNGQGCGGDEDCATGSCNNDMTCGDPRSCKDGVKGGDETDVDCGGSCPPCDDGQICTEPPDCVSNVCADGVCVGPTCTDTVQNGDETDVDCGGSCMPCEDGEMCLVAPDCISQVCDGGVCVGPTCADAVHNGDETDVDCGGSCMPCEDGEMCLVAPDCISQVCDADLCSSPTCTDTVQNGDETDVDCGGSCMPCEDGEMCLVAPDCISQVCDGGVCVGPTCADGVQNGDETDVDCGGSCMPCEDGETCLVAPDCISQVCNGGTCSSPTCVDMVQNGDETDVDCGGSCPSCAEGQTCILGTDCQTEICTGGICVGPSCTDGLLNASEIDVDCGGPDCGPCGPGQTCFVNTDCDSLLCDPVTNTCNAPDCGDGVTNGDETDLDCGGTCGSTCEPGEGCLVGLDCLSFGCDVATGVCNDYLDVEAGPSCSDFLGAPVPLVAQVSGGSGLYSYAWTPNDGSLTAPDQAMTGASPAGFQNYTVTVDDGFNSVQDDVVVVNAQPFDLQNNCTLYSGIGLQGDFPPSITYSQGGTQACELQNNGYGLHLCEGVDFQNVRLQGTLQVTDAESDDDMIGLVWGAQDSSNYYSLTWKAVEQDFGIYGCPFPQGMVVKRVQAPTIDDLDGADTHCDIDTPFSTLLLGPAQTTTEPWVGGQSYTVTIDFTELGSTVTVVRDGDGVQITSFVVNDTTFTSGFFGSTTWSQANACTGPLFAECL